MPLEVSRLCCGCCLTEACCTVIVIAYDGVCVQLFDSGFVSVAGGCLTVTGRTLAENLKDVQPPGVEQVCTGVFVNNTAWKVMPT